MKNFSRPLSSSLCYIHLYYDQIGSPLHLLWSRTCGKSLKFGCGFCLSFNFANSKTFWKFPKRIQSNIPEAAIVMPDPQDLNELHLHKRLKGLVLYYQIGDALHPLWFHNLWKESQIWLWLDEMLAYHMVLWYHRCWICCCEDLYDSDFKRFRVPGIT